MIHVQDVVKRYGTTLAVDRVSFRIETGEVVGFLGPNGAGKSTLLKMISTWLPLGAGHIEVAGHDVVREPLLARASLGYLPEHNALYDGMRVDRYLAFVGKLRGLRSELAERIAWVVDRCSLQDVVGKRIQACSKGYRQRIGLAAALLHDPPIVLLDEPTHGLDPLQVEAFLEFVRELAEGKAILFSSHILSEIVAVSDRVLVIDHGRLLLDAPLSELRERAEASGGTIERAVLDLVRAHQVVAAPKDQPA